MCVLVRPKRCRLQAHGSFCVLLFQLVYDGIPRGDLQQRVIHLRVLSEGAFWENTLLGETFIALRDLDLDPSHRRVGWYQLGTVGQDTVR